MRRRHERGESVLRQVSARHPEEKRAADVSNYVYVCIHIVRIWMVNNIWYRLFPIVLEKGLKSVVVVDVVTVGVRALVVNYSCPLVVDRKMPS